MKIKTEVLLFDLGGVLVEFSGVRDIVPFLSQKMSEPEIRERWGRCPYTEAFCLGKLNCRDFGERFVRDWEINLAPERLGVSPDAVMFFDDMNANVTAALELGMQAFQVDGVEAVRERLIAARLL